MYLYLYARVYICMSVCLSVYLSIWYSFVLLNINCICAADVNFVRVISLAFNVNAPICEFTERYM